MERSQLPHLHDRGDAGRRREELNILGDEKIGSSSKVYAFNRHLVATLLLL
jgi:hypothetical protein